MLQSKVSVAIEHWNCQVTQSIKNQKHIKFNGLSLNILNKTEMSKKKIQMFMFVFVFDVNVENNIRFKNENKYRQ